MALGFRRFSFPIQSRPASTITFAARYETSSEVCMRCRRVRASISPRVPMNVSFISTDSKSAFRCHSDRSEFQRTAEICLGEAALSISQSGFQPLLLNGNNQRCLKSVALYFRFVAALQSTSQCEYELSLSRFRG